MWMQTEPKYSRRYWRGFYIRFRTGVFEGHITDSKLIQRSSSIRENLKDNESALIWKLESEKDLKKIVYGKIERYNFL